MKRLLVLMCALAVLCMSLCSCNNESAAKLKEKASEAVSDMKNSLPTQNDDNMVGSDRETIVPTENAADNTEMENFIATEWDDMVENGEVDDGDGNVGKAENQDGDGNVDEDAVD